MLALLLIVKRCSCAEATDCYDVQRISPSAPSGVYTVQIGGNLVQVYCNMSIAGGGWTVSRGVS